jgi:hypothetical protein
MFLSTSKCRESHLGRWSTESIFVPLWNTEMTYKYSWFKPEGFMYYLLHDRQAAMQPTLRGHIIIVYQKEQCNPACRDQAGDSWILLGLCVWPLRVCFSMVWWCCQIFHGVLSEPEIKTTSHFIVPLTINLPGTMELFSERNFWDLTHLEMMLYLWAASVVGHFP